ncbi:MAG TPA: hypothetical protein PKY30_18165, partial [Myxococcota bacterium]|nr:hypothetical protein [Myxococcota bacterium]
GPSSPAPAPPVVAEKPKGGESPATSKVAKAPGKVILQGAVPRAWLSNGGEHLPLTSPPGRYHLYVQFPDTEAQNLGVVELLSGQEVIVHCTESLAICRLNP